MSQEIEEQLHTAESEIASCERQLGPNHPELAEKLSKYAALLRQTEKRTLDAVNVEARAKAIRAKLYAQEAASQDAKVKIIRPAKEATNPLVYLGIAAMCIAFSTLFLDQTFFALLAVITVVVAMVDLVMSQSRALFRTVITIGMLCCTWWSIQSLPAVMLTDATPMDRLNYASEHAEIVDTVRKMGAPRPVMAYRMCLPEGLNQVVDENDGKQSWGHLLSWKSPALADGKSAKTFQVVAMDVPPFNKKFPNFALGKLAKMLVVPRLAEELNLGYIKQKPPVFEEINGFEFAKVRFSGKEQDTEREIFAFAYVAKDQGGLVVLSGNDTGPDFDSLEPLEASIYTIRKQPGKRLEI